MHGLALGDAGGDNVHLAAGGSVERGAVIERLAQGVDDAPEQLGAAGDFQQTAGTLDQVAAMALERP
jgi:hypothetical protein